jgi:hypothetical protein
MQHRDTARVVERTREAIPSATHCIGGAASQGVSCCGASRADRAAACRFCRRRAGERRTPPLLVTRDSGRVRTTRHMLRRDLIARRHSRGCASGRCRAPLTRHPTQAIAHVGAADVVASVGSGSSGVAGRAWCVSVLWLSPTPPPSCWQSGAPLTPTLFSYMRVNAAWLGVAVVP